MRFGLRARFILLISAVLLCVFASAAYFLVRNVRITQVNDLNRESKAFASLATQPVGDTYTIYKDSGIIRVQQEAQQFTDLDPNVTNVEIVGLDGGTLYQPNAKVHPLVTAGQVETFNASYATNRSNLITQIIQPYFNAANQHPFSIVYTISDKELVQNVARQEIDIVVFSLLGLIASAVAAFELISRFFLSPVEKMSQTAMLISHGNYDQQMKAGRNDEIGDLARSVNHMSETLKSDIQKLQEVDRLKNEFITITSHNLRTPLTIINGNLELLKESEQSPQIGDMIQAIELSTRSLGVFAEEMLTIASIENGESFLRLSMTPVNRLLHGLKEEFTNLASSKGVTLDWKVDDPAREIVMSEVHLRGAVRNLLDNAIKFTGTGGRVSFDLREKSGETLITVTDTGIGISVEEFPKLFTKFHRGTSVMVYDYAGTGIGLYAAKLVVTAHGGTIEVDSQFGQGSTFIIHLPNHPPAPKSPPKSLDPSQSNPTSPPA